MKFITKHTTEAAYDAVKNNLAQPHVALVVEDDVVHYIPQQAHDYSQDYFTTVALEQGIISAYCGGSSASISYSTDNGNTWSSQTINEQGIIEVNVNQNDKVLWKGSSGLMNVFLSTCEFNAEGNIMSLRYEDNFASQTTIGEGVFFQALFGGGLLGAETKIVDASNMVLPATTLTNECYNSMFQGCTSLATAPTELPATTLADRCYQEMFEGCTSLTTAPSSIGNSSTTMTPNACAFMFMDCTSLTTAPELPSTTLAEGCYSQMFNGCTSLTTAPELPATTLASDCYESMFFGCTRLNSITCLATNIISTSCTSGWVNGVASNGTFTKAASMTSWTSGNNGIPTNWTVQNA